MLGYAGFIAFITIRITSVIVNVGRNASVVATITLGITSIVIAVRRRARFAANVTFGIANAVVGMRHKRIANSVALAASSIARAVYVMPGSLSQRRVAGTNGDCRLFFLCSLIPNVG